MEERIIVVDTTAEYNIFMNQVDMKWEELCHRMRLEERLESTPETRLSILCIRGAKIELIKARSRYLQDFFKRIGK